MKDMTPQFDGEDRNYKTYRKKVNLWIKVAAEKDSSKQGTLLILYMTGKAAELLLDETETTVSSILEKLDSIYGNTDDLLNMYEEFQSLHRLPRQTMKEYIHTFDQKVAYLKSKGLDIPEVIQSSHLLKGSSLSPYDEKIARATSDTKLIAETKAALLRISDSSPTANQKAENRVTVKDEPY